MDIFQRSEEIETPLHCHWHAAMLVALGQSVAGCVTRHGIETKAAFTWFQIVVQSNLLCKD